ncbi:hypothetical protein A0H76_2124 [Hepatospora eriocheir]|uniref:Uncharacterized protein n=1 Tax=Hepatospora eriocheir TaxID=1081669 RepID=A0A1X0QK87_9MICR|nr:hypothetical protein A0H76_2124 [Hepatospora eriocheir]
MPATTVFSYIVPRTASPVIPQIMPMLDQSQLSNPFTDPFSNQFNDPSLNQNPNQFTFPNTNSTSNDLQQPPITTLNSSENTSSIPVNDDEELDKQFATLKKLIDEIGNSKPNNTEQCIIQPTLPMCPTQPQKIKNECSIDSLMGCSNKPKPADKCSINNIKMCKTSFLSNLTENNNSSSLKGNNLVEKSNLEGKSNLIKNDKTNTENNKKKSLISKMKELLKSKLTTSNLIKQPEIAEAYTENQEPNDTVLLSDLINH